MFYALRNLFALLGFAAVVVIIYAAVVLSPTLDRFKEFDEKAFDIYSEMVTKVIETGNAAEASVWKVKVNEDLSVADVEETMRFVANEHNVKNVGELPISEQIESMSGKKSRYMRIFMFCNAMTASRMLDYSDAYSAFLPCRTTLIEDKDGALWLYALNMDAMIYGGIPLPDDLKAEAIGVKEVMLDIMNRGAEGDF